MVMDISIKDLVLIQAMQILLIHQLIPMQWIDGEVLVMVVVYLFIQELMLVLVRVMVNYMRFVINGDTDIKEMGFVKWN